MSSELDYDSIDRCFTFLPYQQFTTIRSLNVYFKNLYPMPKMKQLIKREKALLVVNSFWRQAISRMRARRLFILKLINIPKFRNEYLFIHKVPIPHLCIKKWTPFIKRIFFNNIEVLKRNVRNPTYDEICGKLHNMPEKDWDKYISTELWDY